MKYYTILGTENQFFTIVESDSPLNACKSFVQRLRGMAYTSTLEEVSSLLEADFQVFLMPDNENIPKTSELAVDQALDSLQDSEPVYFKFNTKPKSIKL